MMKINLLPWREARRIALRRKLAIFTSAMIVFSAIILVAIHHFLLQKIQLQQEKNVLLKNQWQLHAAEVSNIKVAEKLLQAYASIQEKQQHDQVLLSYLQYMEQDSVQLRLFYRHLNEVKLRGSVVEMSFLSTFLNKIDKASVIDVENNAASEEIVFEVKIL